MAIFYKHTTTSFVEYLTIKHLCCDTDLNTSEEKN